MKCERQKVGLADHALTAALEEPDLLLLELFLLFLRRGTVSSGRMIAVVSEVTLERRCDELATVVANMPGGRLSPLPW